MVLQERALRQQVEQKQVDLSTSQNHQHILISCLPHCKTCRLGCGMLEKWINEDDTVESLDRAVILAHGDFMLFPGARSVWVLYSCPVGACFACACKIVTCWYEVCAGASHKSKRQKQIKKLVKKGLMDSSQQDPFTMFVASTKIRYCYYYETHKILGNTFGMCVLQVLRLPVYHSSSS